MKRNCENMGCDARSHLRLFIDDLGFKGRFCQACYDKRTKELYGEPEPEEKPKIRFISDLNYDYFKEGLSD